ncbi:MAG: riboflavin synthase subunit alpha [Candidatus Edwardsbacteria bacterium RIFOXYD12_FULL_50_11]|jgi:riboflavin synthase|uniref:Riboflavin synthase n=1 Tax=Candidatus Edwardsbacteria bacterium GWF2_54_11 TaxID=1817851 RepID=A0A1F5RFW2_9BACT|nr:MAG: riboflavin synthase subunit alpha [Candidatus Edwardsbacteria bacterium RifOxyC12_full_54_24]OGF07938.1 MAG: riboflavin synthase subunit alpha [Candidatus Edwardsbacteria bacterium RifOxyA12_full_54_48]OGF10186.1 MAG: riboflavin synthase subunit alpha [Candidatus Edwardsbacteria bacterium GWE2_54_12]OGF12993.1 MAG: riboflavin synthase subunit alpha [Candidatus Edwardsbacteria bacterium GWF2_54_11]OGF15098.1 MAG: riboflavin synthase subunit alpha [Candidatus Edwardsbacteria bacterium RIF
MFTGLIEQIGTIKALKNAGHSAQIDIAAEWSGLVLGESIAVNGACLTVARMIAGGFSADLSRETISKTSFSGIKIGAPVNLERALKLEDRFGGHFVSGHVDCTAKISKIILRPGGTEIKISIGLGHSKYIIDQGSVAVDGISLTASRKEPDGFWIAVIPHTLEHTNLKFRKTGDQVNLEFDMMVKYTESIIKGKR